jgi:hypothetical protein
VFSINTPSKISFLSLLVFSTMLGGKKGKLRSAARKAATANRAAKRRSGSDGSSGGSEGDPRFGPRPSGYPRPPPSTVGVLEIFAARKGHAGPDT